MKRIFLLMPLLGMLAACGGSSGNVSTQSTAPTQAAPPAPAADAFTGAVLSVIETSNDTAEPTAVDTPSASAPEDTEPVPVS